MPELAPPGAGIPALERWIGGAVFRFKRWRGTPQAFNREFSRERHAIRGMCQGKTCEALSQRVLIPRLRGLEDSSRYWSVWMTLDHLRIVNRQIAGVIGQLLVDQVPPGVASTAAVKPGELAGPDVVDAYERSCDLLMKVVGDGDRLKTSGKYAHPWFGPLDASGWHALSAMHMGIHRAQIERILIGQPGRA